MKAICSFSGGLDSMLAAKIILNEGIEVEGVYFRTGFGGCGEKESALPVKKRAESIGIKLTVADVGQDLLKIIRSPRFGFGRNMNPCMDCHALFFKKCAEYMKKLGGSFVITGEVLGERPMSQRKRAMREIDEFTGLGGLVLRPLSAKLLEETVPEKKKWVKREKLFGISGRSRKPQRMLAEKLGIGSYPNSAGGCLLTQKDFSRKLKDLMENKTKITVGDISALRSGRHFRLSGGAKFVAGRDKKENSNILENASKGDVCFMTVDIPGPAGVLSGKAGKSDKKAAADIIAAYSDAYEGDIVKMRERKGGRGAWRELHVEAGPKRKVRQFLV
ncbi:MAG: tRNA 4-thiouridine(8) synthase ThiI [Candidatus Omnitrophota bacterium]